MANFVITPDYEENIAKIAGGSEASSAEMNSLINQALNNAAAAKSQADNQAVDIDNLDQRVTTLENSDTTGTTDHAQLSNLGYDESGHTGFVSTADLQQERDDRGQEIQDAIFNEATERQGQVNEINNALVDHNAELLARRIAKIPESLLDRTPGAMTVIQKAEFPQGTDGFLSAASPLRDAAGTLGWYIGDADAGSISVLTVTNSCAGEGGGSGTLPPGVRISRLLTEGDDYTFTHGPRYRMVDVPEQEVSMYLYTAINISSTPQTESFDVIFYASNTPEMQNPLEFIDLNTLSVEFGDTSLITTLENAQANPDGSVYVSFLVETATPSQARLELLIRDGVVIDNYGRRNIHVEGTAVLLSGDAFSVELYNINFTALAGQENQLYATAFSLTLKEPLGDLDEIAFTLSVEASGYIYNLNAEAEVKSIMRLLASHDSPRMIAGTFVDTEINGVPYDYLSDGVLEFDLDGDTIHVLNKIEHYLGLLGLENLLGDIDVLFDRVILTEVDA